MFRLASVVILREYVIYKGLFIVKYNIVFGKW
jgi:hypothetical protein